MLSLFPFLIPILLYLVFSCSIELLKLTLRYCRQPLPLPSKLKTLRLDQGEGVWNSVVLYAETFSEVVSPRYVRWFYEEQPQKNFMKGSRDRQKENSDIKQTGKECHELIIWSVFDSGDSFATFALPFEKIHDVFGFNGRLVIVSNSSCPYCSLLLRHTYSPPYYR